MLFRENMPNIKKKTKPFKNIQENQKRKNQKQNKKKKSQIGKLYFVIQESTNKRQKLKEEYETIGSCFYNSGGKRYSRNITNKKK